VVERGRAQSHTLRWISNLAAVGGQLTASCRAPSESRPRRSIRCRRVGDGPGPTPHTTPLSDRSLPNCAEGPSPFSASSAAAPSGQEAPSSRSSPAVYLASRNMLDHHAVLSALHPPRRVAEQKAKRKVTCGACRPNTASGY
jgi:hypothetical protein